MFYTLPPTPPAVVYVASLYVASAPVPGDDRVASECKRGSRDCFPQDRVGYQPDATEVMVLTSGVIAPRQDS